MAGWQPVAGGELAGRAREAARETLAAQVAGGDGSGAGLCAGAAGRALALRAGAAAGLVDDAAWRSVLAAARAVAADGDDATLESGSAGVELAAALCGLGADGGRAPRLDAVDGGVELLRGAAGIGAWALARADEPGARAALGAVVERIAAGAGRGGGRAWWPGTVPRAGGPGRPPASAADLGVAHGAGGLLGVLAGAARAGVEAQVARELLAGAVAELDARRAAGGGLPAWHAPGAGAGPSRLAWCYGELGVAAALAAAGDVEPEAAKLARALAARAAARGPGDSGVADAGLCHGAAGVALLFARLANALGDEGCAAAARAWLERTLAMRGAAGWLLEAPSPGLLTGEAGVAAALVALSTGVEPLADRALGCAAPVAGTRFPSRAADAGRITVARGWPRPAAAAHHGRFAARAPVLARDSLSALHDAARAGEDELRAALRKRAADPLVRDALAIAAPGFASAVQTWRAGHRPDPRLERTLARYLSRMAGRATPFGLFAAVATGRIERAPTALSFGGPIATRTALDLGLLASWAQEAVRDPEVLAAVTLRPNPTMHAAAGRLHHVEARGAPGAQRSHHVVALDPDPALAAALACAADGAAGADVAAAVARADGEATPGEARAYVAELVEADVLIADLAPPLHADDPAAVLQGALEVLPGGTARALRDRVAAARAATRAVDAAAPGERSAALGALAATLPPGTDPARTIRTDAVRDGSALVLGEATVIELRRGAEALRRLATGAPPPAIAAFCARFTARYEREHVPLLEALDREAGVGFDADEDAPEWPAARTAALLARVGALGPGEELALTEEDLDRLAPEPPPLPGAFAVIARVAAGGATHVLAVTGPSGARALGRFAAADPELRALVADHLRAEEALDAEAVFAEVAHVPEGRAGNLVARPSLRAHEIAILGAGPPARSGAAARIALDDLLVTVRDGRPELWSRALGRRVVARQSAAHDARRPGVPVHRFLALAQHDRGDGFFSWRWGPLAALAHTPRVRAGRVLLAPAAWRPAAPALAALAAAQGHERARLAGALREALGLPRHVLAGDGRSDRVLPIDLDSPLGADLLADEARRAGELVLTEEWPAPDDLAATGPGGAYACEVVVPFVTTDPAAAPRAAAADRAPAAAAAALVRRRFPPGSEWLYARLACGPATADRVLRDVVAPLAADPAVERWHVVRYADPGHHLRLRLHGDAAALAAGVRPRLEAAAGAALDAGLLHGVAIDTYVREIERYGGPEAIAHAEAIFHHDSVAALAVLEALSASAGHRGTALRSAVALAGVDRHLRDAGLSEDTAGALLRAVRDDLAGRLGVRPGAAPELGAWLRDHRALLTRAFEGGGAPGEPLHAALAALEARSARTASAWEALDDLAARGRLTAPVPAIAGSVAHMWVNRVLRAGSGGAEELALYDALVRLRAGRAARARG